MKILFFILLQMSLLMAQSYSVDQKHSLVSFKVRHMLFTMTEGTFERFAGKCDYDRTLHLLEGEVWVDSLTTKDAKRDAYLKSSAFFDVEKYPKMFLKLIRVEGDKARLELTIKDIKREVLFDMDIKDRLSLHGTISRKAFNLHFSKLAETGGIAVGDRVTIDIKIAKIDVMMENKE